MVASCSQDCRTGTVVAISGSIVEVFSRLQWTVQPPWVAAGTPSGLPVHRDVEEASPQPLRATGQQLALILHAAE